jgi:hypothetical protein
LKSSTDLAMKQFRKSLSHSIIFTSKNFDFHGLEFWKKVIYKKKLYKKKLYKKKLYKKNLLILKGVLIVLYFFFFLCFPTTLIQLTLIKNIN